MFMRLAGACLILLGCGSFGFLIAGNAVREMYALRNLINAIDYMICDLQYKSTPLPALCKSIATTTSGAVSRLFHTLAGELESSESPDVTDGMKKALSRCKELPIMTYQLLERLGQRLGLFDLDGQVRTLDAVRQEAMQMLNACKEGHEVRSRSCKTIAVCAGAAIVILLI